MTPTGLDLVRKLNHLVDQLLLMAKTVIMFGGLDRNKRFFKNIYSFYFRLSLLTLSKAHMEVTIKLGFVKNFSIVDA